MDTSNVVVVLVGVIWGRGWWAVFENRPRDLVLLLLLLFWGGWGFSDWDWEGSRGHVCAGGSRLLDLPVEMGLYGFETRAVVTRVVLGSGVLIRSFLPRVPAGRRLRILLRAIPPIRLRCHAWCRMGLRRWRRSVEGRRSRYRFSLC